ncbi:MAG: hypothetical protein ABJD11_03655 [Gemmatimonadota bacterium]
MAGAGAARLSDNQTILTDGGAGYAVAATAQYRSFVVSGRWAKTAASLDDAWDAGLLAGLGTSPEYVVRGSIAAGVGRVEGRRGGSGLTIPLEFQLTTRLTSTVGLGLYSFASLSGPVQFAGGTLMIQIGQLR